MNIITKELYNTKNYNDLSREAKISYDSLNGETILSREQTEKFLKALKERQRRRGRCL